MPPVPEDAAHAEGTAQPDTPAVRVEVVAQAEVTAALLGGVPDTPPDTRHETDILPTDPGLATGQGQPDLEPEVPRVAKGVRDRKKTREQKNSEET